MPAIGEVIDEAPAVRRRGRPAVAERAATERNAVGGFPLPEPRKKNNLMLAVDLNFHNCQKICLGPYV